MVKMSSVSAFLGNRKRDNNIFINSSSSSIELRNMMDEVDKSKKGYVTELRHLEFTGDVANLDDQNEEEERVIGEYSAAEDANEANSEEQKMTLVQALNRYPKAACWSALVATTLVMEGFDTTLLNALFALPVFQRKFGTLTRDGGYEISSKWQISLNMCVYVGEIVGLQMTGLLVEYMGNRHTMIIALLLLTVYIFILYFANSLAMIAVGQILSAMPWGAFQSLAVGYASEISPLALRYYVTTYSNICWLFGQIFASGIMKNSETNLADSEMGYKLPFALQWLWPVPLAIGIFFAPESPWWLVRKNRMAEAKTSLSKILSGKEPEKEIQVNLTLEQIKLTIEKERAEKTNGKSFFDCFRGVDGRRTRITCLTWVAQNTSGSILLGYSTYFFQRAGMATSNAFTFSIISYCLGLVGTVFSWVISDRWGRWTILTAGLIFQMITLLIIGGLGFSKSPNASWGSGGLLLTLSFFYNAGIGAVVYCIVAEMPSPEMRTQTIVLARNCYNMMAIINSVLTPYMLNVENWNWGAKSGLYWGVMTALTLVWVVIDLPETYGRTFSDLNELFARGIPARKFKSTAVDPFGKEKVGDGIRNEDEFLELSPDLPQQVEVDGNKPLSGL